MNDQEIEQKIQDKGLTAPRLTPSDIDSVVHTARYWQPEGTTLTVCALQLRNGMQVVGESACVSHENFDAELGREIASKNAWDKIWALEGYLLRDRLQNQVGQTSASIGA
jgi:hypothetical protein